MRARVVTALSIVFVLLTAIQSAVAQSAKSANKSQIAHGEYLVKDIAGCPDCHTPMNETGEFVPGQWLKGTKLTFGPLLKLPAWADTAPNIGGLEGWDTEKGSSVANDRKGPKRTAAASTDAARELPNHRSLFARTIANHGIDSDADVRLVVAP